MYANIIKEIQTQLFTKTMTTLKFIYSTRDFPKILSMLYCTCCKLQKFSLVWSYNRCLRTFKTSAIIFKTKPEKLKGKKISSQLWISRQINDPFVKKAREENWRCRSAFKLIEIDDKYDFLKPGNVVIDCGASPGSWSQVAVQRVNADNSDSGKPVGRVISIDLHHITPIDGATIIQGCDFTDKISQDKILTELSNRKADVVMSDMAPPASGTKHLDHEVIVKLCISVLRFSTVVLKNGGVILCKLWMGREQETLQNAMEKLFQNVKIVKPESSRSNSAEIFMLGRNYLGLPN